MTKTYRTTVQAQELQVGDVILSTPRPPEGELRTTVTTPVRRLGGSGLVAFGLDRVGRDPWEGRVRHDSTMDVERPLYPAPATTAKARCYWEYCCNAATFEVEVLDRSGTGRPAIPWGWCDQHKHHAWSVRSSR